MVSAPPLAEQPTADQRATNRAASRQRIPARWRWTMGIVGLLLVFITLAVLTAPASNSNGYLAPSGVGPEGANAITDLLSERGQQVVTATSAAGALSAVTPTGSVVVVTSPELLTSRQLSSLSAARADLVFIAPNAKTLHVIAPAITTGQNIPVLLPLAPSCQLRAADLAGSADFGLHRYRTPPGAVGCYPYSGLPSLVSYRSAGHTSTILGDGAPLTNASLFADGNAALALNLLAGHTRVIWLVPLSTVPSVHVRAAGGPPLIPRIAWLVVLQLLIAVLLAVVWRARRFGPLISEGLPIVVRASETVEGHGRLYQSTRARDRAADMLRTAVLARLLPRLGLDQRAPREAVAGALAARTRRSPAELTSLLFGPAPTSDAAMLTLARSLDDLEREVLSP